MNEKVSLNCWAMVIVYGWVFSSPLRKPSKIYTCFFFKRFGLFLIHLQSNNKATLGNASNSKPKDSITQEITVWRKRLQNQTRPQTLSKSLKVKAGPTAMQKVLKQNLRMIVIYGNKPRPAARDRSQSTTNKGCKRFNTYQYYNQHDMSTSAPTTKHETCINIRTEHRPNIWHNDLRIEEV